MATEKKDVAKIPAVMTENEETRERLQKELDALHGKFTSDEAFITAWQSSSSIEEVSRTSRRPKGREAPRRVPAAEGRDRLPRIDAVSPPPCSMTD